MTFSIIGTGNIAWFFGSRIVVAKHHCMGVYGRDKAAAKSLAESLLADLYGTIEEIEDGVAEVCFLAVSDIAIAEVAARLRFKQTVLVHTAGSLSIDAIKAGAEDRAVLWPVYSILRNSPSGHRKIPCAFETSSAKANRYVREMGHAITDVLFEAKYDQRKWLHLSAVIGNNFINHLLAICEQICTDNELPFSILLPIIEQTFDRSRQSSAINMQTGPAIRHDANTIAEQTALLEQHAAWQKVYVTITQSIQAGFNK